MGEGYQELIIGDEQWPFSVPLVRSGEQWRFAYPAKYGPSGVMTFIVDQDGTIYEQDLGSSTANEATAMTEYTPDDTGSPPERRGGGVLVARRKSDRIAPDGAAVRNRD